MSKLITIYNPLPYYGYTRDGPNVANGPKSRRATKKKKFGHVIFTFLHSERKGWDSIYLF